MQKLVIFVLIVAVLTCAASAYEAPEDFTDLTLEEALAEFMDTFGMSEENFSLSYYNTVTGEEFAFNDEWFTVAASTYKLPLNMYFYEMQQAGEITGDTIITWTGWKLDDIHEQSIVHSNNELSEGLMYYWGEQRIYKEKMRKYFTMTDAEIDPIYYQNNSYCTRMMMDALKYLYDNQESFEELIGYMKLARPNDFFKAGVQDYEVAHKYGADLNCFNDVGIVYTPQPFLLAVYTHGDYGAGVCAEAAKLMTAYTIWQEEHQPAQEETMPTEPEEVITEQNEAPETAVEEPAEQPETVEVPEEMPQENQVDEENAAAEEPGRTGLADRMRESRFPLWIFGVAALAVLLFLFRFLRYR